MSEPVKASGTAKLVIDGEFWHLIAFDTINNIADHNTIWLKGGKVIRIDITELWIDERNPSRCEEDKKLILRLQKQVKAQEDQLRLLKATISYLLEDN